MKIENIKIWEKEEYDYKMAYGFIPNIMFYLHEDEIKRPFMLVVPGGGYGNVSYTEGKLVSDTFYNKGYNVGVLTYTVNVTGTEPLKKQPLNDIGRAIRLVRKNGDKLNIDVDKVCVCGFSAGGHLTASISVHYNSTDEENEEYLKYSPKPNAVILSYPVITVGEYAHQGSVQNLIGNDVYENLDKYVEELEYFSLEKQVNSETVPTFIWHTATDDAVPVENAYLFAQALQKSKVQYALHIFSYGPHGLSVANDKWSKREFGEPYTIDQVMYLAKAIDRGEVELSDDIKSNIKNREKAVNDYIKGCLYTEFPPANDEVAVWVDVAEKWLDTVL